jgi:hypothetical protein
MQLYQELPTGRNWLLMHAQPFFASLIVKGPTRWASTGYQWRVCGLRSINVNDVTDLNIHRVAVNHGDHDTLEHDVYCSFDSGTAVGAFAFDCVTETVPVISMTGLLVLPDHSHIAPLCFASTSFYNLPAMRQAEASKMDWLILLWNLLNMPWIVLRRGVISWNRFQLCFHRRWRSRTPSDHQSSSQTLFNQVSKDSERIQSKWQMRSAPQCLSSCLMIFASPNNRQLTRPHPADEIDHDANEISSSRECSIIIHLGSGALPFATIERHYAF